MEAWPIEEVFFRPALTLLACACVPFATARLLRLVLFARPASNSAERARQLFPLRLASMFVGVVQLQLAWTAGATALGPALVREPHGWASQTFAAACVLVAFVAGGIARREEESEERRSTALGVALLRLRFFVFLCGPLLAAILAASLPIFRWNGSAWEIAPEIVVLAFVVCAIGVAYSGLLLALVTTALRPAARDVRATAMSAAKAERTPLWLVLRLPTDGTHFANAAAIPWARAMVVSDALAELLSPNELRAVLAHEAAHLSEPKLVALFRIGAATVFVFALTVGVRLAAALGIDAWLGAMLALALGLPGIIVVRRLARRMEERADERARATVGAEPLAGALAKLHEALLLPLTTGARRVHPDLYDRLQACGVDPGPRPAPPRRRLGLLVGAIVGAALCAGAYLAYTSTRIDVEHAPSASLDAARWSVRIAPWDARSMLAWAWAAHREGHSHSARARLAEARRIGISAAPALELQAEMLASEGDCDAARAAFERALAARSREAFARGVEEPLRLGDFRVPPSLITECGELEEP